MTGGTGTGGGIASGGGLTLRMANSRKEEYRFFWDKMKKPMSLARKSAAVNRALRK
jgi:hypothetical protein